MITKQPTLEQPESMSHQARGSTNKRWGRKKKGFSCKRSTGMETFIWPNALSRVLTQMAAEKDVRKDSIKQM